MKIRLHPRNLLLYCAVAAASIAFSSFYGGPASYAWLYAVLLLIPLSAAYIGANYHFLRIFQEIEVHRLVRGEDHSYRAKIENASPLPIHNMGIRLHTDRCTLYEIADGQKLSLEPHGIKELTSGISCKYAGSYDIGIRNVDFTDPFGLFTVILDVPYTFRAVVSPPVTNLADTVLDLENLFNSSYLKSSRLTEDTPGSDMRPYQTGDPLKAINWKVSARLGEMVTRIPDKMEKRTVTILMQAAWIRHSFKSATIFWNLPCPRPGILPGKASRSACSIPPAGSSTAQLIPMKPSWTSTTLWQTEFSTIPNRNLNSSVPSPKI